MIRASLFLQSYVLLTIILIDENQTDVPNKNDDKNKTIRIKKSHLKKETIKVADKKVKIWKDGECPKWNRFSNTYL